MGKWTCKLVLLFVSIPEHQRKRNKNVSETVVQQIVVIYSVAARDSSIHLINKALSWRDGLVR